MLPIAHRGLWWPHVSQQNTVEAMQQAADLGFAIEIDVHRVKRLAEDVTTDSMAIGHDVPKECDSGWPLFPGSYIGALASAPAILWNIKTAGLAQMLPEFIFTNDLQDKSFIFDQDFPGMPKGYSRDFWDWSEDLNLLARVSDRNEPDGVIGSEYCGVWLDQFDSDWLDADIIQYHHNKGKAVFIVSSELHNRPLNLAKWKEWLRAGADFICTDFPGMAHELIRTDLPLQPIQPWWQEEEWKATVAKAKS